MASNKACCIFSSVIARFSCTRINNHQETKIFLECHSIEKFRNTHFMKKKILKWFLKTNFSHIFIRFPLKLRITARIKLIKQDAFF
jgi:hypothetical protein